MGPGVFLRPGLRVSPRKAIHFRDHRDPRIEVRQGDEDRQAKPAIFISALVGRNTNSRAGNGLHQFSGKGTEKDGQ
jgi:hypothetical protein